MNGRYNHKAIFMQRGMIEAAPGLEICRRYDPEADAAEFWRQNDIELAQEKAARQRLIQRVGLATVTQLEQTANQIEREQRAEREQARQKAAHERKMAQIKARVAADIADERAIASLKARGVAENDLRIQRLRLGIQARKLRSEM